MATIKVCDMCGIKSDHIEHEEVFSSSGGLQHNKTYIEICNECRPRVRKIVKEYNNTIHEYMVGKIIQQK